MIKNASMVLSSLVQLIGVLTSDYMHTWLVINVAFNTNIRNDISILQYPYVGWLCNKRSQRE